MINEIVIQIFGSSSLETVLFIVISSSREQFEQLLFTMLYVPSFMSQTSGGCSSNTQKHNNYQSSSEELNMLIQKSPNRSNNSTFSVLHKLIRFDPTRNFGGLNSLLHPESSYNVQKAEEERSSTKTKHNCQTMGCERVTVNVSGMYFETRLGILNRHPRTLLGSPAQRALYYDFKRKEYFFDRHRPTFEAIFNYYQYGGKLKRPNAVQDDIFLSELEFYQIEKEVIETYKRDEGYIIDEVILPENPVKKKIWMLFEYPETSALALIFAIFSVICTVASIILFCVETLPRFNQSHCVKGAAPNFNDTFFILESICTTWFTVELLFRLTSCPDKFQFVKDFKNVIDLSAIIPYYVTLTNVLITFSCEGAKSSASLAFLRVIRLVRVFKLTKHSPGLQVLILTFRASMEGLGLFLVALIVCILVFSSTIYYVEIDIEDSEIESIPDAFWWAVITMCTVGYGDKVPKGPLGKLVGSICAVAGVLTLAIPVPIITENFNKFYTHKAGNRRI